MYAYMGKKCSVVANELRFKGNDKYEKRRYEDALHFYNKSLCFAEGESLSLAYANKACLSFKCQKVNACLKNIQLARENIYPVIKMTDHDGIKSVNSVLMKCMLNQLEFLKLSYPANEKLPFIVDCLELKTNETYGRHIITNRDLKVGDTVGIEKPSCMILDGDEYRFCGYFYKLNKFGVFPCIYCVKTMYCSESCRENATEERHLNKLGSTNNVIGMDCGLFSRIASRMECDTVESNGGCISNVKELFCENELHPKTVFDFDFSDSDEIIKNEKNHLLAMFSLIDKVNFAILDNDDVEIYFSDYARRIAEEFTFLTLAHKTDGIFLFGSLLNHSCAPNIVVYQFEEKNVYMVIRPITEGQQLFISYGPSYLNQMKQDRQKKLIKKLGFQCDCEACDGNYPTKEELQKASSDLAHIELPSWPYLDPSSTVELAIQRYKHYCALLQSTPELLLNNYDGILVTEYIISCVMKIIAYEPKMF